MFSSRASSQPRDVQFRSSTLQVESLLSEPPGKPKNTAMGSLSLLKGELPNSGIQAGSSALQVDFSPAELPGKPLTIFS